MKNFIHRLKQIWYFKLPYLVLKNFYSAYLYPTIFPKRYQPLKKYKDRYHGKRCFIVATGPSLTLEDVEKVKGEITFGMNSVFRLFDKTDWRPDFYGIIDTWVFSNIKDELAHHKFNCAFYPDRTIRWKRDFAHPIAVKQGIGYNAKVRRLLPEKMKQVKFSDDISKRVYEGTSVVHFLLQIIFYMGFEEIYLLGTDCNYSGPLKHSSLATYKNSDQIGNSPEDIYYGLIKDYEHAAKVAKKRGIKIYNATRGGMLEVFPRVKLEEMGL